MTTPTVTRVKKLINRVEDVVAESLERVPYLAAPTLADYAATDAEARRIATELLDK